MTVAHWLRSRRWSVWLVALLSAVVMGCSAPLQSSFEFHANLFAGDHLGDRTAL